MQLRISSGMVDTKIDEIRGKDEITRRVISQLEALRNSPLGQTQDGRPLPLAALARMEVPGYRLELEEKQIQADPDAYFLSRF